MHCGYPTGPDDMSLPLESEQRPEQTPVKPVTRPYLRFLVGLLILAGYWISKGAPDPILIFTEDSAKEECLRLANENKGKSIMLSKDPIEARNTWLKDGKRVVQLIQTKDEDIKQILCIYGNGLVQIPSLLEQMRWR